jgi:multicomponent Na+:H+ antiporter subunit D
MGCGDGGGVGAVHLDRLLRPDWLYRMLPNPAEYHPYTSYHVSETLLVLLFTAVGFFLLIRKLAPEATISVDLDWFYRKGGDVCCCAGREGPAAAFLDDLVGRLYRAGGPGIRARHARGVAWFDGRVIDALVDGVGGLFVRGLGGWLRGPARIGAGEPGAGLWAGGVVLLGFLLVIHC